MNNCNPFNGLADSYDQWYDSPFGAAVFRQEIACLRLLQPKYNGKWLEVGVGSGRFACELGLKYGLDPAEEMLRIAAGRGIVTRLGQAEDMPYADESFHGVMLAFTLCFIQKPALALQECGRVLRPGGKLLLGVIPGESRWAQAYKEKARNGHPLYSHAVFYSIAKIIAMVEAEHLVLLQAASALLSAPDQRPDPGAVPEPGINENAGFVVLCCQRPE